MNNKELYTLKIKPYAENEMGGRIEEFDDDEWDLIIDLFERLIRNFKLTFPEVEFDTIETSDNKTLVIKFKEDPDITEIELDYHIETLCGHNLDNVIFFDDEEYAIRANIVFDEVKSPKKTVRSPPKRKEVKEVKEVKDKKDKKDKKVKSPPKNKTIKSPVINFSPRKEDTLERYQKIYQFFLNEK